MDKAPDAFRTISEVAEDLDIPQHVLRFWESRFPQIKPMKRAGGRRYYRPDDVALLKGIRHLLYGEGYTIRGVQRILKDQGPRFVQTVWQPGAAAPPPEIDAGEGGPEDSAESMGWDESDASSPDMPQHMEPRYAAGPMRAEPSIEPRVAPGRVYAEPTHRGADHAPVTREPVRAGLGDAERQTLSRAMQELSECRRILEAARAGQEHAA